MQDNKWLWLQLFAGEGAGGSGGSAGEGAGADAGDSAAAAGQQRLRELGVPEDRIRKNRAYRMGQQQTSRKAGGEEQRTGQEQAAAANEDTTTPTEEEGKTADQAPQRMTWEQIMADPEYNKAMQATMQQRLKASKGNEEAMQKLAPALEMLMAKHGMDPGKPDYAALAAKIMDDDTLYEDKAIELNVDTDVAKKLTQQDLELKRLKRQETMTMEQQRIQQHFAKLEQQGQTLRQQFPGFDLRKEMQNPVFSRMVSPDSGLTVEDAYYAVHRKDIQNAQAQVIASQTAQAMTNAIRSNSRRPDESGAGQAPSVASFDYRKASKAERNDLKQRIRNAAARGEKIYPGQ